MRRHLSQETRVCAFIFIQIMNVDYFLKAVMSLAGPSFCYQHASRENFDVGEA